MSHKFRPGQRVVCIDDKGYKDKDVIIIPKGTVVTIAGQDSWVPDHYDIEEYPVSKSGYPAAYKGARFRPLISSTTDFVEVTYTKIIETVPKTCAS